MFEKCLIAMTKINEVSLPMMGQAYNQYIDNVSNSIKYHPELNQARAISKSAVDTIRSGYSSQKYANSNVSKYLSLLEETDKKLDYESKNLNELLLDRRNKFLLLSKKISNKNLKYMNEMKSGNAPAEELLLDIVKLGKEIQSVINEVILNYKKEVMSSLKKIENKICSDAVNFHKEIHRLDANTLPPVRQKEWTYLPDELFHRSGAFVNNDYEVKL